MTLVLVAELKAKPGQAATVLAALAEMVEPSLAEEGCLSYRPLVDPRAADTLLMLEEWVDEAALQFHFATDYFVSTAARLEDLLAEPFTLRRLTDVSA